MTSIAEIEKMDFPLGVKVTLCRVALGLSQIQLSKLCKLTQVQISLFEKGRTKHVTTKQYEVMMRSMYKLERSRTKAKHTNEQ
jgi:transcriptional regulator with XRE-family HTH domain